MSEENKSIEEHLRELGIKKEDTCDYVANGAVRFSKLVNAVNTIVIQAQNEKDELVNHYRRKSDMWESKYRELFDKFSKSSVT